MTPPCKDCPDRQLGCHGKCPRYATYHEECEKQRQDRHIDALVSISPRVQQAKAAKLKRQKQGRP